MSQDQNIDDGYEENPWDDEDGENLRVVKDFLPPPSEIANFKTYIVSDEKNFSKADMQIIERLATEKNITITAFMAGVLHDFANGQLVKREN